MIIMYCLSCPTSAKMARIVRFQVSVPITMVRKTARKFPPHRPTQALSEAAAMTSLTNPNFLAHSRVSCSICPNRSSKNQSWLCSIVFLHPSCSRRPSSSQNTTSVACSSKTTNPKTKIHLKVHPQPSSFPPARPPKNPQTFRSVFPHIARPTNGKTAWNAYSRTMIWRKASTAAQTSPLPNPTPSS